MEPFEKDQVLQWHERLEEELLEIFKYMPPADPNLETFSPRLATLIIESCGLLDSVLRQISADPVTVDGKPTPRGKLTIKDYAKLYAEKFQLTDAKSILLTSPPRYLIPFGKWKECLPDGEYPSPDWWRTHTALKHDRIANLKAAKLGVAIESLCALHLVLAKAPEFAKTLLSRSWVFCSGYNPTGVIEILEGVRQEQWMSFLVESKLFVVARGGGQEFPDNIDDFKPSSFKASERVVNIFGRWY